MEGRDLGAGNPGGRGRGRGRTSQAVEAELSAETAAVPGPSRQVSEIQENVRALGISDTGLPPVADLGRSRGRGRGRGASEREPQPRDAPTGRPLSREEEEEKLKWVGVEGQFDDAVGAQAPALDLDLQQLPEEDSPVTDESPPAATTAPSPPEGAENVSESHGSTSVGHSRVGDWEIPKRALVSRPGSKGKSINVATNYLRLKLLEGRPGVVEYHVSFDPLIESVGLRRTLVWQLREVLGNVRSFDGMILFLPNHLPQKRNVFTTTNPNDNDSEVKITINFVKVKAMDDCLVFFNLLLKRIMHELKYVELRREYYDLNLAEKLTQHKLEIWPGTNITTEFEEDGLMVCVDTCSRVLRTDTVFDFYSKVKNEPDMKKKFTDFVLNRMVLTRYNNKCYKIDDIGWDMRPDSTFNRKGEEISFKDYFKQQYNVDVKYSDQPMLLSKMKPRRNERYQGAQEVRIAALVPECCFMTGLTDEQRANFKVMTDLAGITRLVPEQRMENLNKFVDKVLSCEVAVELLNAWGLTLTRDVVDVSARQADGAQLMFNKNSDRVDRVGPDFSRESGRSCYDPVDIKKFVVICTERDKDKATGFIKSYKSVVGPLGIRMPQDGTIITLRQPTPSNYQDLLKKLDPETQFVVLVMPQQRDDVYSAIKRYCVATSPIPSQCVLTKTLSNEKRLRSIVLKIALQINCKLGGSLWALKMPQKEDYMLVGIDVAHDPLKKDPSVICLVATMNNNCTKYFSRSSTLKVHQEMGDTLGPLMHSALDAYYKERSKYPDKVIVFRDGGSMGALDQIVTTEMNSMRRVLPEREQQPISLSFVVVNKRIRQRFFLKQGKTFKNPEPGTIVDSTVTRRDQYDFFIVSQQVRQGTVNPTHFVVLNPDDPIGPDMMQRIAYVTCFMYYNWSGTVRVPAMVQYAHKLAALLHKHVKTTPAASIARTLYYL